MRFVAKSSYFCKVPMGGALDSENWGLCGFSLILGGMLSLIAVLSARWLCKLLERIKKKMIAMKILT